MPSIVGIVLAAGEGRRAGGVKALLKLGDRTFLATVVSAIRAAGCESVIVVGGAEGQRVEAEASRLGAVFVMNEDWRSGQFSSLKAGAAKALGTASTSAAGRANERTFGTAGANSPRYAALVALVDHPWVRPETYRTLLDAFRASPGRIVIPICEDTRTGRTTRGHPVVVPAEMLTEIVAAPDDTTLRDLIRREADTVLEVRVEDAGVLKDVDTLADLKELGGTEV